MSTVYTNQDFHSTSSEQATGTRSFESRIYNLNGSVAALAKGGESRGREAPVLYDRAWEYQPTTDLKPATESQS
jgi:hypothetical protein